MHMNALRSPTALVIASANRHKAREIKDLLKSALSFDLFTLLDFPLYTPLEEEGSTFKENATVKALHAAKELGLYALADDSGLVVPALRGKPGLFSARYAGAHATDLENRQKLLRDMQDLSGEERFAYYECSMVLASPEKVEASVKGVCEGALLEQERGSWGFGYDSLFLKHDYGKTFAELPESTKSCISHRGKAFAKMLPHLLRVFA